MKKYQIILIAIAMITMPIIAILIVWCTLEYNIFDNPDFWYGYMSYFGTIVLAAVALWQNYIFKEENDTSQTRLENINKQSNEINTINKILEFEYTRIHKLYSLLDDLEKSCHPNNIAITMNGCLDQRVTILQACEKCDFLYLAVSRELRIDKRQCEIKDKLLELCFEMYTAAIALLNEYDKEPYDVSQREAELSEIWNQYFITKEKYINSTQGDFQRLLYETLSLDEIRKIYYNVKSEEENNG